MVLHSDTNRGTAVLDLVSMNGKYFQLSILNHAADIHCSHSSSGNLCGRLEQREWSFNNDVVFTYLFNGVLMAWLVQAAALAVH